MYLKAGLFWGKWDIYAKIAYNVLESHGTSAVMQLGFLVY